MKKITVFVLLLLSGIYLNAQNCSEVVDLSYTAFVNGNGDGTALVTQTIQSSKAGSLTRFRIYFTTVFTGNLTISVFSGLNGPSGNLLYQYTYTLNSITGAYDCIIPVNTIPVTSGTPLTVRVQGSGGAKFDYSTSNPYAFGWSNISGGVMNGTNDLRFQTYITTSTMTATISNSSPVTSCSANPTALLGTSVSGATYQWWLGGSQIPSTNTVNYTPDSALCWSYTNSQTGTYYYTVTDNTLGCTVTSNSVTATAYISPKVTQAPFTPKCSNGAGVLLTGGSPAGGIYSGTSISVGGNYFYPSVSGPGSFPITYTYTDANQCSNTTIQPLAVLSPGSTPGVVSGASPVCTGTSSQYSVPAAANATFYKWAVPSGASVIAGIGTNTVTVSYSPAALSGSVSVADSNAACALSGSSALSVTVNNPPAISSNPTNQIVCAGPNATFSVLATGSALTYQWKCQPGSGGFANLSPSATYPSVTNANLVIVNPTIALNGYTYECVVTGSCGTPVTSSFASLTINTKPAITSLVAKTSACMNANTSFVLTAAGTALTYHWQFDNGSGYSNLSNTSVYTGTTTGTLNITNAQASQTGNYRCIINGTCPPADTSVVIPFSVTVPATLPTLCLVTADSLSNYNIIYWDKTQYASADSFIVYRYSPADAGYMRIGAVSKDSSHLTDIARNVGGPNGGDPTIAAWQYKFAILDTCGHLSAMSPYHETCFMSQSHGTFPLDNFGWNQYTVEAGQTNPVTGYSFSRDSVSSGNWRVLAVVGGLAATDATAQNFPTGNWRAKALGFTCTATRKEGDNSSLAKINGSKTNIRKGTSIISGIRPIDLSALFTISPNPATKDLNIRFTNSIMNPVVCIYNTLGKAVLSEKFVSIPNSTDETRHMDISLLAPGVYMLILQSESGFASKKLIVQ